MGERKGQNHYYPPDYDPKVGGLNKFLGTHALRERARKLHLGILIIRFEMPYNIWCDGCNNHIGMGVRYNAEKTKLGMYYTTPVYQFRMKCHLCDNHFEIKTDPGNLDYVIVSGARRQENRWDPTENGQIVPETKETQKRLFDDAMFKLEHKTGDEDTAKLDKPRLGRLVGRNESVWKDDYEANCSLRRNFRKRRKELEESSVNDSLLLTRSSLNITLLPESEEDRNMASLLSLRPSRTVEEKQELTRSKIFHSPALPSSSGLLTSFGGLKKEESLSKSMALNRNVLGVVVKKNNFAKNHNDEKNRLDNICTSNNAVNGSKNEVTDSKSLSKSNTEVDMEYKVIESKWTGTDNREVKDSKTLDSKNAGTSNIEVDMKNKGTTNEKPIDKSKTEAEDLKNEVPENIIMNNIETGKIDLNKPNETKLDLKLTQFIETKSLSLICDYSSSEHSD